VILIHALIGATEQPPYRWRGRVSRPPLLRGATRILRPRTPAGVLSDAECRVLAAFPTGSRVELGAGNADDLARPEDWGPDRHVRATLLVSLLCGAVEVEPGLVGEINLYGARVIGKLGYPGVTFKHRLRLNNCYVADGIDLTEATARTVSLEGCRIVSIQGPLSRSCVRPTRVAVRAGAGCQRSGLRAWPIPHSQRRGACGTTGICARGSTGWSPRWSGAATG
jgi:hypothetical protein